MTQQEQHDFDYSDLTIRRELVSGNLYYYGYKKISGSNKLFKTYLGKDLSKLSKMQKISVIGRKKKLSNGHVINYIFQKLSRAGLDYTNDQILESEIDRELASCFVEN